MSRKTTLISATVLAAALLATVAVARTVHTHTAAAPALHATVGAAPQTALRPHTNFACAQAVARDCEKLDWFPE